eukprot:c9230_g1_i1.p1 GENE.c9230_g1_i1~~c9230_g1_i1.p1  ORF type:complete len:396 (+),score=36.60 c9230_g1_i1:75-1262(+)
MNCEQEIENIRRQIESIPNYQNLMQIESMEDLGLQLLLPILIRAVNLYVEHGSCAENTSCIHQMHLSAAIKSALVTTGHVPRLIVEHTIKPALTAVLTSNPITGSALLRLRLHMELFTPVFNLQILTPLFDCLTTYLATDEQTQAADPLLLPQIFQVIWMLLLVHPWEAKIHVSKTIDIVCAPTHISSMMNAAMDDFALVLTTAPQVAAFLLFAHPNIQAMVLRSPYAIPLQTAIQDYIAKIPQPLPPMDTVICVNPWVMVKSNEERIRKQSQWFACSANAKLSFRCAPHTKAAAFLAVHHYMIHGTFRSLDITGLTELHDVLICAQIHLVQSVISACDAYLFALVDPTSVLDIVQQFREDLDCLPLTRNICQFYAKAEHRKIFHRDRKLLQYLV